MLFASAVVAALLPSGLLTIIFIFVYITLAALVLLFIIEISNQSKVLAGCIVLGMIVLSPAIILWGYTLLVFVIGLYPTLINLWGAWLVSKHIASLRSRLLAIVALSFVFGLNCHIFPVISDLITSDELTVVRPIELTPIEALAVNTSVDKVAWKRHPTSSINIQGWHPTWGYPAQDYESLYFQLQRASIRYRNDGLALKRLEVTTYVNNGLLELQLSAWDGGERTAFYKGYFRQSYLLDYYLIPENEVSIDSIRYRLIYLAQGNLWNLVLAAINSPRRPIKNFIGKAFQTNLGASGLATHRKAEIIETRQMNHTVSAQAFATEYHPVFLECDGKVRRDGNSLTWSSSESDYTFNPPQASNLDYVRCTEQATYVMFRTPRWDLIKPDQIEIIKFSTRGETLEHHIVTLQDHVVTKWPYSQLRELIERDGVYYFYLNEFRSDASRESGTVVINKWRVQK